MINGQKIIAENLQKFALQLIPIHPNGHKKWQHQSEKKILLKLKSTWLFILFKDNNYCILLMTCLFWPYYAKKKSKIFVLLTKIMWNNRNFWSTFRSLRKMWKKLVKKLFFEVHDLTILLYLAFSLYILPTIKYNNKNIKSVFAFLLSLLNTISCRMIPTL